MPKSEIRTRSSSPIRTFAGLMSRWQRMPRLAAYSMPWQNWIAQVQRLREVRRPGRQEAIQAVGLAGSAPDVLHREVRPAADLAQPARAHEVGVLAEVDPDARLLHEEGSAGGVAEQLGADRLERQQLARPVVRHEIDDAEAAFSEHLHHLQVLADEIPSRERGQRGDLGRE